MKLFLYIVVLKTAKNWYTLIEHSITLIKQSKNMFLKGLMIKKWTSVGMEPWLPAHMHLTIASPLSCNFILYAGIFNLYNINRFSKQLLFTILNTWASNYIHILILANSEPHKSWNGYSVCRLNLQTPWDSMLSSPLTQKLPAPLLMIMCLHKGSNL